MASGAVHALQTLDAEFEVRRADLPEPGNLDAAQSLDDDAAESGKSGRRVVSALRLHDVTVLKVGAVLLQAGEVDAKSVHGGVQSAVVGADGGQTRVEFTQVGLNTAIYGGGGAIVR